MEHWSVLGEVVAQQKVLAVPPNIWVVRHVHFLQCRLVHQLTEVPDGNCTICWKTVIWEFPYLDTNQLLNLRELTPPSKRLHQQ